MIDVRGERFENDVKNILVGPKYDVLKIQIGNVFAVVVG